MLVAVIASEVERLSIADHEFSIGFVFVAKASGFEVWLAYDPNAFLSTTVERIALHFHMLARGIAAQSSRPLADIPLLSAAETRQFVDDWSVRREVGPLVHRQIEARAKANPSAVALRHREQTLSYGELDEQANQLAHWLLAHGVTKGERVAVCVGPSLDISVALLGIFKIGAVHVPLEPSYPVERLSTILADVEPAVILVHEEHRRRLQPPGEVHFLALDRDRAALDELPNHSPEVEVVGEDIAYIIYTSGTTGVPKGVMTNHANLEQFVRVAAERYELSSSDVVPAMARFSFSITMFEMFLPLVVGGQLWILDRDHVVDLPRLVQTLAAVTLVHASPSLLRLLVQYLREHRIEPAVFDGLRHLSSGGDFVSADLLESLKPFFRHAELFVIYGSSEIACMGTTFPVPRDETLTRSKVGKPFPDVRVRIVDAKNNVVPVGVAGEILFAGRGVTPGYFRRPDLTAQRYVDLDGARYYRMGDIGRYDSDGNVEILGRSDFQIKLRGMRIELGDIEAALRRAPGIRDAVATAFTPEGREKVLVAYVVPSGPYDVGVIRRYVAAQLPDYMVPSAFVVLSSLPVNMNMKLDRRALPPPTEQDFVRHLGLVPPSTQTEQKLLDIWKRVLGTSLLGIQDDFFEAGGDSLLALPLMIEIEKVFGVALPMTMLLTEPTIETIGRALDAPRDASRPDLVSLRKGDHAGAPPLFLVHDGEGECIPYLQLAERFPGERAIYGIQPHARGAYPMLHSRLDEVARHYVSVVRRAQPNGPYFLGGLCIGGFIALEMARHLQVAGERVDLVALIDVAHVTLPPKSVAKRRAKRLGSALREGTTGVLPVRALGVVVTIGRRLFNLVKYELTSRTGRAWARIKMRLFRFHLDRGISLPDYLANIPVRVVLRFAEREYVIPEPYRGSVTLIRATKKDPSFDGTPVDDTPYVDLFDDPMLGWAGKTTPAVTVYDVPGGHSSMLQDPHVAGLGAILEREATLAAQGRSVLSDPLSSQPECRS